MQMDAKHAVPSRSVEHDGTDRPADETRRPTNADKPRLLIVDDIAENREILRRRFERQGFHATEASGGIEALALLDSAKFDLVLLDMMMPDLTGLEVLGRIRARLSAGSLPVIMVTARSQNEDIVEALDLGANDYITKPVDFSIALARVNTQLGRKRAEDKVHQINQELFRTNEALEHRVAERTRDLIQANQQLRSEMEQREKSQATIAHLAHHDALTGLGNRLLFHKQLDDALLHRQRHGGELAVLFVDLDGFKSINDTLGHGTGDAVLKHLAARLKNALREGDRIGRLGGDEFAIIQIGTDQPKEATALATRLIEVVQTPFSIDMQRLVIGASIGIAVAGGDYQDSTQLLRAADLAMYRAKADGRGRFRFFEAELDRQVQERRELEIALRKAVESDALEIHYQPLVNVRTGRISGFEALSRWQDPTRGTVPPSDFIQLAEEIGLIGIIGERVLRRACAEAARWPQHISVAVNLSPAQFQGGQLIATVKEALASSGLAANRLELEITESIFLQGSEANLAVLGQLGELGVKIAMDDFGTGYSSLSYLRSFPFHKIKIDKSFIRDLSTSQSSVAIVRAVCGLARGFGASTTAEGVETDDQLTQIQAEGCTEVQGYFFSKPLPASDVPALLARLPPPTGSAVAPVPLPPERDSAA
ncbi:MAG: EAL domain-containing protein [Burkholderiaceae bacterium]|nr:EAL domain-containing protein [Burkholderiaceae bacterium]